jgi:hypothetical protein
VTDNVERFISTEEAADFLSCSVGFLYKWRASIPHYRAGGLKTGKLLWKPSELAAWVESRRVVQREPVKASA